jgi:hypothetical protein
LRTAHTHGVDAVLDLINGRGRIARTAEVIRLHGSFVSTPRAADEEWFKA